jgi:hypothetical protein
MLLRQALVAKGPRGHEQEAARGRTAATMFLFFKRLE